MFDEGIVKGLYNPVSQSLKQMLRRKNGEVSDCITCLSEITFNFTDVMN